MASNNTGELLRGIAFFDGLPDTLLWHLAKAGERQSYAVDDLLFSEGAPRAFFAIILDGNVAIERADTSSEQAGASFRLDTWRDSLRLAASCTISTTRSCP